MGVDTAPGDLGGFKGNPILWYNNGVWGQLGFAVPNPGQRMVSSNSSIIELVGTIGRNLQALMMHDDASLRTPPSINTITRIHKLCLRARSILFSRSIPPATANMEAAHNIPDVEPFILFPTPYFKVRNVWMKTYAGLTLGAISEAMQHQENIKEFEISTTFGGLIGQYFERVYRLMCTELLRIDLSLVLTPGFTLSDAQLASYDPTKWFTSTELIDTVVNLGNMPSAYDLMPLSDGIAASQLPVLGPYPFGADGAPKTANGAPASPAATSEAFLKAPTA